MTEVEELVKRSRTKEHNNDKQYWEDLISDIRKFLSEDHPEEEKLRLRPIGALEMAYMMLTAIEAREQRLSEEK